MQFSSYIDLASCLSCMHGHCASFCNMAIIKRGDSV